MLNRKTLLALAGILVVLAVISLLQDRRHEQATSQPSSELLLPGTFTPADLARVEISHAGQPAVTLAAAPDGWRLESAWGAPVDLRRLETLLASLSDLRGEFRSDLPQAVPGYGFTDSTTVAITGLGADGQQAFAIEVGGRPQGGAGSFVRRPGSPAVYVTQANLLGNLGLWSGPGQPASRHFLDLSVLALDRTAVDAVTLTTDEGDLTLVKEFATAEPAPGDTTGSEAGPDRTSWEWRIETDGETSPAAKTRADAVLGAVVNLRAQDVADPTADLAGYGLASPARSVTLRHADGTATVVRFGDERPAEGPAPGGVYAQVDDDPTVWVVGTFNVGNIFKTRDDLVPADLVPAD